MSAHERLHLGGPLGRQDADSLLRQIERIRPSWVTCGAGRMLNPHILDFAAIRERVLAFGLLKIDISGGPESDGTVILARKAIELGLSVRHAYHGALTPPGISIHDRETGEAVRFSAVWNEPALMAGEIDDPARREALKRWGPWRPGPVIVADSRHEYMSALARIDTARRAPGT